MNITIYTKDQCPNCVAAKQLMDAKGLSYTTVNVEQHPALLQGLLEVHPQARQMPQILINGQRVGGLAGLRVALNQMELL